MELSEHTQSKNHMLSTRRYVNQIQPKITKLTTHQVPRKIKIIPGNNTQSKNKLHKQTKHIAIAKLRQLANSSQ
jgi:hypothetical protein